VGFGAILIEATANCSIDINIGLELYEAYCLVDNYVINKWQKSWDNGDTGSHYTGRSQIRPQAYGRSP